MFHHFYNAKHPAGQGALSPTNFEDMIDWLKERYCLMNADEYQHWVEQILSGYETLVP